MTEFTKGKITATGVYSVSEKAYLTLRKYMFRLYDIHTIKQLEKKTT